MGILKVNINELLAILLNVKNHVWKRIVKVKVLIAIGVLGFVEGPSDNEDHEACGR
jgi:hypothetical protein